MSDAGATAQMYAASRRQLNDLSSTAARRVGRGGAVRKLIDGLPSAVPAYERSSHYLAFAISYLSDERVLPYDEPRLEDELNDAVRKLISVIPRKEVRLEGLEPAQVDYLRMRREFHAGGPLDDPDAEEGLRTAVSTLRESIRALPENGALIVEF